MQLDATGKASFDHIYVQPDPRAYFNTLGEFDYRIPQLAKPYFTKLVDEYRETRGEPAPTILDIGCSYGINAVLLKCDTTMDELYEYYDDASWRGKPRGTLLARDRALVRTRGRSNQTRFVGLDTSRPALSYALDAGFIDDAVHADLEERDPTDRERRQLAGVDLIISTGCLGYVTGRTLSRIVAAQEERRPWMAHFVLRMFPFDPIAESLAGFGYETSRLDGVFKQRRFTSRQEQAGVLAGLAAQGVDPRGLEADGWLYAQLYVSRPGLRAQRGRAVAGRATGNQSSTDRNRG